MAYPKHYADQFERINSGRRYRGLAFYGTKTAQQKAARELRQAGFEARSVTIPACGVGFAHRIVGGMTERYLVIIPDDTQDWDRADDMATNLGGNCS